MAFVIVLRSTPPPLGIRVVGWYEGCAGLLRQSRLVAVGRDRRQVSEPSKGATFTLVLV